MPHSHTHLALPRKHVFRIIPTPSRLKPTAPVPTAEPCVGRREPCVGRASGAQTAAVLVGVFVVLEAVREAAARGEADHRAAARAAEGERRSAVRQGHLADDRQAEAGARAGSGRPRPGRSGRRRGSDRPSAMPGPRSRTSTRTTPGRAGPVTAISTGARPSRSNLAAFSTRLDTARCSIPGRPSDGGVAARPDQRPAARCGAGPGPRPPPRRRRGRPAAAARRRTAPAARSTSSLTRSVSSRASCVRSATRSSRAVGRQLVDAAQQRDVRPQRRSAGCAARAPRPAPAAAGPPRTARAGRACGRRRGRGGPPRRDPVTGTWMPSRRVRATSSAAAVRRPAGG